MTNRIPQWASDLATSPRLMQVLKARLVQVVMETTGSHVVRAVELLLNWPEGEGDDLSHLTDAQLLEAEARARAWLEQIGADDD